MLMTATVEDECDDVYLRSSTCRYVSIASRIRYYRELLLFVTYPMVHQESGENGIDFYVLCY